MKERDELDFFKIKNSALTRILLTELKDTQHGRIFAKQISDISKI